jgi:predicted Zn-dependent peptidase
MEERRMRIESNPQGKLLEKMLHTAFVAHPYGLFGGTAKEILALRASEAAKFHQKYYVPSNITVALVGDVEPARAKALAEKYFGDIRPGPPPPHVSVVEPKQDRERRASLELDSQPMLLIGYKRPDQRHKDDPVFDVISSLLSSGRTGMLYRDLVQSKKIALAAQAGATFPGAKYANMFILFGLPNAGHTVEEVEKGIYANLEKLKTEPVDPVALQRVKTKLRAGLIRQLDSNTGLASQLPFYEVMYDDWRVMFKGLDDIDKVSAADVQRVAREYFVPENRTAVYSTSPAKGAAK